jgi:hypothetical protein
MLSILLERTLVLLRFADYPLYWLTLVMLVRYFGLAKRPNKDPRPRFMLILAYAVAAPFLWLFDYPNAPGAIVCPISFLIMTVAVMYCIRKEVRFVVRMKIETVPAPEVQDSSVAEEPDAQPAH